MYKDLEFRKFILEEVMNTSNNENENNVPEDVNPRDITLGSLVRVSQGVGSEIKTFDFEVVNVWNDPKNIFSIISISKDKVEENAWILFYSGNSWYIRRMLKGPINIHVDLIGISE